MTASHGRSDGAPDSLGESSVARRGLFITLEGIDGAGKTTQFEAIQGVLRAAGREVVATREPGGTPLGERLREILLHQPMRAPTEALLMFAARQEHVLQVIEPALQRGTDVVCDRYTHATLAYQGAGKGMPLERLQALADWVHPGLWPDLTVLIDLPEDIAATRMQGRAQDRFEREPAAFAARVRAQYLAMAAADPGRWAVIDGGQEVAAVRAEVERSIENLLRRTD